MTQCWLIKAEPYAFNILFFELINASAQLILKSASIAISIFFVVECLFDK
jgi:hypothetical protein